MDWGQGTVDLLVGVSVVGVTWAAAHLSPVARWKRQLEHDATVAQALPECAEKKKLEEQMRLKLLRLSKYRDARSGVTLAVQAIALILCTIWLLMVAVLVGQLIAVGADPMDLFNGIVPWVIVGVGTALFYVIWLVMGANLRKLPDSSELTVLPPSDVAKVEVVDRVRVRL